MLFTFFECKFFYKVWKGLKVGIFVFSMGKSRKTSKEAILDVMKNGAKTREEIARKLKVSEGIISSRLKEYGVEIPHKRKVSKEAILNAMNNGAGTREEIARGLGASYQSVVTRMNEYGIELPRVRTISLISTRDRLIRRGLSLGEIAEREGVTGEAIRSYINRTEQYKTWRKSREFYLKHKGEESEFKNIKNEKVLQGIAKRFYDRALNDQGVDAWAFVKSFEYRMFTKYKGKYSMEFNKLFELFKVYRSSQLNGRKLSLQELVSKTQFNFPANVRRVLNKVGLEAMNGSLEVSITAKEDKETIKRSVDVEMPFPDIAYFIGVKSHVVQNNLRFWGLNEKRPKTKNIIKRYGREECDVVNYRNASQVFEAFDLGFSHNEIKELFDLDERVLNYILENKDKIGEVIIDSLGVMYPNKKISKPYKTW
jgi:DNA-binding CsgD family transcriptional regulator